MEDRQTNTACFYDTMYLIDYFIFQERKCDFKFQEIDPNPERCSLEISNHAIDNKMPQD